ncbi:MAG TPA: hypothetical protein VLK59_09450 [Solirubrobacteraceae bacterium]|nr:hypothetical protein [Solirubrobacteraceae bacterium]
MQTHRVLVLGASYGSLLASKLLLGGHDVTLVCLPAEADLINRDGTRVRMPVRGRSEPVVLDSRVAPGRLSADVPEAVDPAGYDIVGLAMQEPQYGHDTVRGLLGRIAEARVPCMSIMNMPPLPYLARIPGIDPDACRDCYADPTVWDVIDPALLTMCSPDPQAVRPPDQPDNVLQVRLPTNFKAAPFAADEHTAILRRFEADIDAIRYRDEDGSELALPVKLRVRDSLFVPLAKWSMLLAGNYRCIQPEGPRPIREAVHSDLDEARAIYDWVRALCMDLGAAEDDLVPFEKYATAAEALAKPSSVARAVFAGAPHVERVDRLVQTIAAGRGMHSDAVDKIVALVDSKLEANARVAA